MIRNLVFDYGGVAVNVHGSVVRRAFMDLRVARWKQILYYRLIKRLKDDFIDGVRMAGFAPLFAGSADAGRAALAALLPNTFLQALVWQALTAPELPEVTEHEDL